MVDSITSLSRSGLRDWLLQRVSAVIIVAYVAMIVSFFFMNSPMKMDVWQSFFAHQPVKIATFLALFSVVIHAWVGMWTVYTDYVKCSRIRLFLQVFTIFALLSLVVWGAVILWG